MRRIVVKDKYSKCIILSIIWLNVKHILLQEVSNTDQFAILAHSNALNMFSGFF